MRSASEDTSQLDKGLIRQIVEAVECLQIEKTESGIEKFSVKWFVEQLNGPMLARFNDKIRGLADEEADLVDFVKITLELVKEKDYEVVLVVASAIDFYKQVCETYGLRQAIKSKHISDFVIEVGQSDGQQMVDGDKDGATVKTKAVAMKNHFSNVEGVRQIDVDPPILFGNSQVGLKRLRKERTLVDRNLDKKGFIKK